MQMLGRFAHIQAMILEEFHFSTAIDQPRIQDQQLQSADSPK
jgi:hypothetical protein